MLTSPRFYLLGMNSHLKACLISMFQVLNGLLTRSNPKEGVSIPIGIVPAGSDNSLVWTVLGVRDPISAALSIVKGGLTATDVFAVEWIHTGIIHFGMTVSYYGFVSDGK
jgi:diacylglycerol kinase family enzyme